MSLYVESLSELVYFIFDFEIQINNKTLYLFYKKKSVLAFGHWLFGWPKWPKKSLAMAKCQSLLNKY